MYSRNSTLVRLVELRHRARMGTWYAFECIGSCVAAGSETGTVVDIRTERTEPQGQRRVPARRALGLDAAPPPCPVCAGKMTFRGSWKADEQGYGRSGGLTWEYVEALVAGALADSPEALARVRKAFEIARRP